MRVVHHCLLIYLVTPYSSFLWQELKQGSRHLSPKAPKGSSEKSKSDTGDSPITRFSCNADY